jgi:2-polyprenyl-3-methyl-5-hydroxy-6-metoxy-1,4-benzoquinol methylase
MEDLQMNDSKSRYAMGYTERERRRLALQAALQNPVTEQLLRRAGILSGMRILDLGCGVGDVSLLAARVVGRRGAVTGIDVDEDALEVARARAREQDLPQVTFERRAIEEPGLGGPYDAVVGRHILIHTPDPLAVLKRVAQLLRPGGVVAFHEYDFSLIELAYPAAPVRDELARLFLRLVPSPNMGKRLYHDLLRAGFSCPQCQVEGMIDGGAGAAEYEVFAQAAVSILPRAEAAGLGFSLPRDAAELARRLERESVENMGSCPMPFTVAAHARWVPASRM